MVNNNLIIESNSGNRKVKIRLKTDKYKRKYIEYTCDTKIFQIVHFTKLLNFLSEVSKSVFKKLPIIINLQNCFFADKLTFIILECVVHYYINEVKCSNIIVQLNNKTSINTQGLLLSPLKELNVSSISTPKRYELFNKKFNSDLSNHHFRRIILKEDDSYEHPVASLLMQDIESYLKIQEVSKEYTDTIPSVISELADNVIEHSGSDCLVDIDITTSDFKKFNHDTGEYSNENYYYGLNVVVANLSEVLIGEKLREKVLNNTEELPHRYKIVKKAYNNLKNDYDENYNEEDFFVIASFQDRISGRIDSSVTGGKGLTELLKSLQENINTDKYDCYMFSGNKVLWFKKEFLNYNSEGWIGFNKQNNFHNYKPDPNVFTKIPFYFPGTAYNLTFVVKKD